MQVTPERLFRGPFHPLNSSLPLRRADLPAHKEDVRGGKADRSQRDQSYELWPDNEEALSEWQGVGRHLGLRK